MGEGAGGDRWMVSVGGYCEGGGGYPVFTPWDNKLSALSHRPANILPVKTDLFMS